MLTVAVEKFQGPLDLLLELIEAEKLDVTEISIARVAEQFIASLEQVSERNPEELADFLVVAAKLLLIKSRVLLPYLTLEGEDDGRDLEHQLKMYRVYYEAAKVLRRLLRQRRVLYAREHLPPVPVFSPPQHVTAPDLGATFRLILARLEPVVRMPREVMVRTVSLQQTIGRIRDRLEQEAHVSFTRLMGEAKSKVEVIVTFLALLELVKQRSVGLVQRDLFGDITVERVTAGETA